MAIIKNEWINNGKPFEVRMKGSKRRKHPYADKKEGRQ